jgi:predicted dienelactone hydrolase
VIIRENEVMALIDQISNKKFLKDILSFDSAVLDISKIVVSGHSFGGITALGSTH